jgi:hypothetical protein
LSEPHFVKRLVELRQGRDSFSGWRLCYKEGCRIVKWLNPATYPYDKEVKCVCGEKLTPLLDRELEYYVKQYHEMCDTAHKFFQLLGR